LQTAPHLLGTRQDVGHTVERPLIGHIVDQQNSHRTTVIRRSDGPEAFLPSRIPDLELNTLPVELDGSDLEVDANRRDEGWRERVLAEA